MTTLMIANVQQAGHLQNSSQRLLLAIILLKIWFKIWDLSTHLLRIILNQGIVTKSHGFQSVLMVQNFQVKLSKKEESTVSQTQRIVMEHHLKISALYFLEMYLKMDFVTIIQMQLNVNQAIQLRFIHFFMYMTKKFQVMTGNQLIVIYIQTIQCVLVKETSLQNLLVMLMHLRLTEKICLIFMVDQLYQRDHRMNIVKKTQICMSAQKIISLLIFLLMETTKHQLIVQRLLKPQNVLMILVKKTDTKDH